MMDLPPPPNVVGISLSGKVPYVISRAENRELCRSVDMQPAVDDRAHPIYFFIATQVGMGMTVAELCSACEFNVADGPMMASSQTLFQQPLKVEQPYLVTGEITNLARKPSRKFGVMDMLEYQLRLALPNGAPVLITNNLWVLPRLHLA